MRGFVTRFIKDISYKHSVKMQIGLSVLFFLLAQTPIEYFLAVALALMAYLDYEDGHPLI